MVTHVRYRGRGAPGFIVVFERPQRVETRDGRAPFVNEVWLRFNEAGRPVMCVQEGGVTVEVMSFSRAELFMRICGDQGTTAPPWAATPAGRELWMGIQKLVAPVVPGEPPAKAGGSSHDAQGEGPPA